MTFGIFDLKFPSTNIFFENEMYITFTLGDLVTNHAKNKS